MLRWQADLDECGDVGASASVLQLSVKTVLRAAGRVSHVLWSTERVRCAAAGGERSGAAAEAGAEAQKSLVEDPQAPETQVERGEVAVGKDGHVTVARLLATNRAAPTAPVAAAPAVELSLAEHVRSAALGAESSERALETWSRWSLSAAEAPPEQGGPAQWTAALAEEAMPLCWWRLLGAVLTILHRPHPPGAPARSRTPSRLPAASNGSTATSNPSAPGASSTSKPHKPPRTSSASRASTALPAHSKSLSRLDKMASMSSLSAAFTSAAVGRAEAKAREAAAAEEENSRDERALCASMAQRRGDEIERMRAAEERSGEAQGEALLIKQARRPHIVELPEVPVRWPAARPQSGRTGGGGADDELLDEGQRRVRAVFGALALRLRLLAFVEVAVDARNEAMQQLVSARQRVSSRRADVGPTRQVGRGDVLPPCHRRLERFVKCSPSDTCRAAGAA